MDISISEAFKTALEGGVVDPEILGDVDHEVRALLRDADVAVVPSVVASCITAFVAGMVYQSQFVIEGPGTVTVEMDSETVSELFRRFLLGGRDE